MNFEMPIRRIMTTRLVTIEASTPIREIQLLFSRQHFHHLPVITPDKQLVGIVSREDLRKYYLNLSLQSSGHTWTQRQLDKQTAEDLMTHAPLSLDPDDTIGLAADIFLANRFHALPVVEDNALVGILTSHDILAYVVGARVSSPE